MDPDEALTQMRRLTQDALDGNRLEHDPEELLQALGEQFQALDEFLSKGGFKPKAWAATDPNY